MRTSLRDVPDSQSPALKHPSDDKNQTAHEVTRDVTAWACQLVHRLPRRALRHTTSAYVLPDLWSRADAAGKLLPAWARLGPLSTSGSSRIRSHRRLPATCVVAA